MSQVKAHAVQSKQAFAIADLMGGVKFCQTLCLKCLFELVFAGTDRACMRIC